jgi:GH24 family phage-related lysozyme (muramidase)
MLISSIAFLVIGFEGIKQVGYFDQGKTLTVCYGHTGKDILDRTYSLEECKKLLDKDILTAYEHFERCIGKAPNSVVKAYTSAIYNTGQGIVCSNTQARRFLIKKDYKKACNELTKWVYIKGKKSKGLIKRRDREKAVCLKDVIL